MIKKAGVSLLLAIALLCAQQRGMTGTTVKSIGPFNGGMVEVFDPYGLADNELTDAQNCDFANPKEIRCRYGYDCMGAIDGNSVISSVYYQRNSSNYLMTLADSSVRVYRADSVWVAQVMESSVNSFIGTPTMTKWKNGCLYLIPSLSASPNDTLNAIIHTTANELVPGITIFATAKIGLPTCTLSVDSMFAGGKTGTYYYAVTLRREYTAYGKTYYEEGNSELKSIVADEDSIRLDNIPDDISYWETNSSPWADDLDSYNFNIKRRVYRTEANGSVLYHIGDVYHQDTHWNDTVTDAELNTFADTYDLVRDNYCMDSLINGFRIAGFTPHDNRFYVLAENPEASYGNVQQNLYYTIPFTNQTPMFFNSSRKSVVASSENGYKTGLISCGGRLYTTSMNGVAVYQNASSNLLTEHKLFDKPVFGTNCVECMDGQLVGMSMMGDIFTSSGMVYPKKVYAIDTSEYNNVKSWLTVKTDDKYKTWSFSALKFLNNKYFASSAYTSVLNSTFIGNFVNGGMSWSRWPIEARSLSGGADAGQFLWIDTTQNKLMYWPSMALREKDYNGTDSSTINLSFTTKWYDLGSFDAVKQLKKVSVDVSLTDTMYIYSYWDDSSTPTDTGTIHSQDTTMATHSGNCYTWYPKRKNSGRYLKLKFEHKHCGQSKMRFRRAKLYYTLTQR